MEQIIDRLREATSQDHRVLENKLGLLAAPLSRARFVAALQGFLAFHRVWEPRVEALVGDPAFMAPRRKLDLLGADLEALDAAASPIAVDIAYLAGPSQAWGSLYVMEGSALGGQVISKALREAPWAPPGGLGYFNPYGRETGAMWKAFRQRLEAAPGLDREGAVSAARQTFAVLAGILPLRHEEAVP